MKNVILKFKHLVKQGAAKGLKCFGQTLNKHAGAISHVLLKFGEAAWTASLVALFFGEPIVNSLVLLVVGVSCTLLSRKI